MIFETDHHVLPRRMDLESGTFELGYVWPRECSLQDNGVTSLESPGVDFDAQVSRVNAGNRRCESSSLLIPGEGPYLL